MISIFHNVAYLAFGLMSPIIMFGNAWWDRRNGKKTHRQRVAEYEETKQAVEADALEAVARYQRESRASAPDPATVLDIALRRRARLWERRRTDPDYLTCGSGRRTSRPVWCSRTPRRSSTDERWTSSPRTSPSSSTSPRAVSSVSPGGRSTPST